MTFALAMLKVLAGSAIGAVAGLVFSVVLFLSPIPGSSELLGALGEPLGRALSWLLAIQPGNEEEAVVIAVLATPVTCLLAGGLLGALGGIALGFLARRGRA